MSLRFVASLALLALSCRPKTTAQPLVDAAAFDAGAAAVTTAVDAAPPPLPTGPAFTLFASFLDDTTPTSVSTSHSVYAVKDGIVVVENRNSFWKVSTLRAGQKPVVVVPKRDWSRESDSSFRGEVWGTTDLVFLSLTSGSVLKATPKGTTKTPKHYRHVVELRDGQWIGLRSSSSDFISFMDSDPVHYDLLAGKGDVIVVPSHLRGPLQGNVVRLGEGRFCATVLVFDEGFGEGFWTADIEGHQHVAPDKNGHWVFRGADGECWALLADARDPPRDVTIARVNGDSLGPAVPAVLKEKYRWQPRFDREGGVWFIDEATNIPTRITIKDGSAQSTLYPVPAKVEGCDAVVANGVTALSGEDVWVEAYCNRNDKALDWMLFHTGPGEPAFPWPPM